VTGLPALPLVPALGTMLASLVLAALLGARTQRRAGRDRGVRAGALVLLAGTTVTLMILTWAGLDSPGDGGVNLIPGAGIRAALVNVNTRLGMMNLLGNIALFVPIGFFAVLAGWNVSRAIAIAAGLSAAIEVVQFLLGRTVDIDDVVLNALGGAMGAVTARAVQLVRRTWAIPDPE
jgi:glycopeptide antibiotics resistance protein